MNKLGKIFVWTFSAMATALGMNAEVPDGYYNSCEGKSGRELLKALNATISSHPNVGYDGLWNVYKQSDVRADGTLWDIYTTKKWSSSFTKCGNYKLIGDCVNREHSMPKSWWGGGKSAQYSDAFHLYPTDGKVNGQRSNFPYGECSGGTRLPDNGSVHALGRLGTSTFSGYNGTVFEPDDEYKGDLARSYFYMAACYNSSIGSWHSDMLAGNSYPVFTGWAINLLMKWTRQDEVSTKEQDRNEAIYTFQHNRNPFIDHPELAEHIWGDKQNEPWYSTMTPEPEIVTPVKYAQLNFGLAAVGVPRSTTIAVKGRHLTEPLQLSVNGNYSVTPASISAAEANEGASVTVTVFATSPGDAEGTLRIWSAETEREVDLITEVAGGLPVEITDVTSRSFVINWINLHGSESAVKYKIHLYQGADYVPGYPVEVACSDEAYRAESLDPLTEYSVMVESPQVNSERIKAMTDDLIPSIQLLYDGDLIFDALPDEPSAAAELLMDVENVSADITITVTAPFSVSSDKNSWARSVTLDPEEDRFYLRVDATDAGTYQTDIVLSAGTYVNDDYEATANVAGPVDFIETWEFANATSLGSYNAKRFDGVAASWSTDNGGFWPDADKSYNKTTMIRMGKNADSSLSMESDKTGGIGTLTFDAATFGADEDAKLNVELSTDGGQSWKSVGAVTVSGKTVKEYSLPVKQAGNARIRFCQQSGKRWLIDNIALSNYSAIAAVEELDYHTWDAYCYNGALTLEVSEQPRIITVYSIDGITCFNERVEPGVRTIMLPAGFYIVVSDDFSRRVLVK